MRVSAAGLAPLTLVNVMMQQVRDTQTPVWPTPRDTRAPAAVENANTASTSAVVFKGGVFVAMLNWSVRLAPADVPPHALPPALALALRSDGDVGTGAAEPAGQRYAALGGHGTADALVEPAGQ